MSVSYQALSFGSRFCPWVKVCLSDTIAINAMFGDVGGDILCRPIDGDSINDRIHTHTGDPT